ncbi:MAG: hypothetical protein Q7S63_00705 [bacterium]|nr:hypothetical protein [bacterium]
MNPRQAFLFLFFVLLVIAASLHSNKGINFLPTAQTTSINLPVPLDNPNIRQVSLFYNFYGRIKLAEPAGNDVRLVLDSSDATLPAFIVDSKDSQVLRIDASGAQVSVSLEDLKPGLTTNIQMTYDLRLSIWKITRVYIF